MGGEPAHAFLHERYRPCAYIKGIGSFCVRWLGEVDGFRALPINAEVDRTSTAFCGAVMSAEVLEVALEAEEKPRAQPAPLFPGGGQEVGGTGFFHETLHPIRSVFPGHAASPRPCVERIPIMQKDLPESTPAIIPARGRPLYEGPACGLTRGDRKRRGEVQTKIRRMGSYVLRRVRTM